MWSETGEMFGSRRVASGAGVDQARRALSEIFLPVDFPSARASTVVDLELNALNVGRVTCGFMRFRDAVRIETAEAENYHIDIPVTGRAAMKAGAGPTVHATRDAAGVFMPGRPVALECGEQFSQLSLMIPRADLQLEVERLIGEAAIRPLEFGSEMDLTTPGARMMLQALRMIDDASELEIGPLTHPLACQWLEQALVHSLLFAQPHNHSIALAGPSPDPGIRHVSHAAELLRESPEHSWTVAELAAKVSVSARSLQQGFRQSLHTTPMAYLRLVRLEKVRDELSLSAPASVTVTEIATRWGFVHLGRFAAVYRDTFGEQPSETLRTEKPQHTTSYSREEPQ
jgi:AraC-like DNA-binding protein